MNVTVLTDNEDYDSVNRNAVMDLLTEGLGDVLIRGWLERDSVGPRGGTSSRLYGVVEVNGILVPVAINVYSDVAIEAQVKKLIGQDKRSDRIRAALESTTSVEIETSPPPHYSEGELNAMTVQSIREIAERLGVVDESDPYVRKAELIDGILMDTQ